MPNEKIEFSIAVAGVVITGLYAIVTGRADEIATAPIDLLIVMALGMVGTAIERTWESKLLKLALAAIIGGIIGALVTSETWFELLFVFLSGCLLVMIVQYALETWRSESSTETIGLH